MKSLFEEQPHHPDHTIDHAPTSGQCKDDQEMGVNAMSKSDVLKNSPFSCFPQGMDLNLGRVVTDLLLSLV